MVGLLRGRVEGPHHGGVILPPGECDTLGCVKYHAMFQPCPKCGNVKNPRSKTCGLCAGKGRKPGLHLVDCRCETCGEAFVLPQWRVNQGRGRFCGKPCRDRWQETLTGEASTKFRGRQSGYRGTHWATARKTALEIYGYRCARCRTDLRLLKPHSVIVHHHIPFSGFSDEEAANATDNLRPMCRPCHAKEERLGKTTVGKAVVIG